MLSKIATQLNRLILHNEAQKYSQAYLKEAEVLYPHQNEYLTESLLEAALEGKITLGVMLAQDKTGLTKAGCIDIDTPRDAATIPEALQVALKLVDSAKELGLIAYIEYSGNKGYHVWLFSEAALYWQSMLAALKAISQSLAKGDLALLANFAAVEYFPERYPETKCIKLPCCVHLRSCNRCGFIDTTSSKPSEPSLLPNQEDLLPTIQQNPLEAILKVAQNVLALDTTKQYPKADYDFSKLDGPPGCIKFLVENGALLHQDYNHSNMTIARYAIACSGAKGASELDTETQAINLATQMANNSSLHSTSKTTVGAKVDNFKSVYKSAKNQGYVWSCGYVLGARKAENDPQSSVGCIGDRCPLWQKNSSSNTKEIHKATSTIAFNPLIVRSISDLLAKGETVRLSSILLECEALISQGFTPKPKTTSDGEALREMEVVAYLLHNPIHDFPWQGFVTGIHPNSGLNYNSATHSNSSLKEYLELLFTITEPVEEKVLEAFKDKGLRLSLESQLKEVKTDSFSSSLERVGDVVRNHSSKSSDQGYLADYIPDYLDDLFNQPKQAIATGFNNLDNILNGGLAAKFYIIAGTPGSGKSTLSSQIADFVAYSKIPVIYAAFEMSRYQLFCYSLSRKCDLNSSVIESKKWIGNEDLEPTKARLIKASMEYQNNEGNYLKVIEADDIYTVAKLKSVILKTRAELDLEADANLLLVVDYLQLMLSGDKTIDASANDTLRVSKIAIQLKQLSRETNTAIWCISDITKAAYEAANKTGSLDLSALRDSFKIAHAADSVLLVQSSSIHRKNGTQTLELDQLALWVENNPNASDIQLRQDFPLNQNTSDVYTRVSLIKNRGGKLGDLMKVYRKALHKFNEINSGEYRHE